MNKCNVIRDLLPLYADEVCSEDSREMVEEHISSCDECKQELEAYCSNTGIDEVRTDVAIKNFKKEINKTRKICKKKRERSKGIVCRNKKRQKGSHGGCSKQ